MKLKNKLALGLAGLTLALDSGCPIHKPNPEPIPEPSPYTFYTDEQEIKDRFVQGENVDVSQALDYNPIPNNPLAKSLISYLNKDKALQTMRTIYVQYGANDVYPYYSGLDQAVAVANIYDDPTEIQMGEGTFGDGFGEGLIGEGLVRPMKPLKINGQGIDKTTLKELIKANGDFIEISNLRLEGGIQDVGGGFYIASLAISKGGYAHDNLFYGKTAGVLINSSRDVTLENNVFDSVINVFDPSYLPSSIIFASGNINKKGIITMRNNTIKNTPRAIELSEEADCGVQGDLGNNMFLDVGIAVSNPYNYPQGFVGNAWAETNP